MGRLWAWLGGLWPPPWWWLMPSGGPYDRPRALSTILKEAPLPAHLTGGALLAGAGLLAALLLWLGWWRTALLLGTLVVAGIRQEWLVELGAYPWYPEAIRRVALTGLGAGVPLLLSWWLG